MGVKPGAIKPDSGAGRGDGSAPPGLAVRRAAAEILRRVTERGQPLDGLLEGTGGDHGFLALDPRDRALTRAILGAALRRRGQIEMALAQTLDRPLAPDSGALAAILHVAAAQILFLDVPDHAAVDLAVVQAAADRRARHAKGLVNAVLRRIIRQRADILDAPDAARRNTPAWLYERWRAAYGEAGAAAIAQAHLAGAGLDLSVRGDAELWADRLGGTLLPTGTIRLAGTHRIPDLPGFAEGAWWVQDAAAALPARLLRDVGGMSVADLCAAPGGKTVELAAAGAVVTAVDISAKRLRRLASNLERLRLTARLQAADILDWQPSDRFDAVLLDAPCAATGTIRRHPDIPWIKKPQDVTTLAAVQGRMLERAAAFVKPDGILVFSTCSLEPEEGSAQVPPFLARHPEFAPMPVEKTEIAGLGSLLTPEGFLRTLPCHGFGDDAAMQGMDGFFAARFRRISG